jgi:hypothetical protein
MVSVGNNESPSESHKDDIVWYRSYAFFILLSLILLYVLMDILFYLNATFDLTYMLVSNLIWLPMMIVLLLFYSPLKVGTSSEGVHVVLPFRRKVIGWKDIKFIGRSMFGISNNYGLVAVFDVHENVHVTGKLSSKLLEDLNSELRRHRAVLS